VFILIVLLDLSALGLDFFLGMSPSLQIQKGRFFTELDNTELVLKSIAE
jgi:hypothetical protein